VGADECGTKDVPGIKPIRLRCSRWQVATVMAISWFLLTFLTMPLSGEDGYERAVFNGLGWELPYTSESLGGLIALIPALGLGFLYCRPSVAVRRRLGYE
jgi:hypothetical protein